MGKRDKNIADSRPSPENTNLQKERSDSNLTKMLKNRINRFEGKVHDPQNRTVFSSNERDKEYYR